MCVCVGGGGSAHVELESMQSFKHDLDKKNCKTNYMGNAKQGLRDLLKHYSRVKYKSSCSKFRPVC